MSEHTTTELYEKSLNKLELPAVLELLAECAVSEEGKDACRRLRPQTDADDIALLQDETAAACRLITLRGSPGLQDVKDVRASLDRADRGGSLSPIELLRIAGVLRCARSAKDYYDGACANTCLDWMFAALMAAFWMCAFPMAASWICSSPTEPENRYSWNTK